MGKLALGRAVLFLGPRQAALEFSLGQALRIPSEAIEKVSRDNSWILSHRRCEGNRERLAVKRKFIHFAVIVGLVTSGDGPWTHLR